ncbi:MAG: GAF domain-containing protein [Oscillochloridaceae bacterium umkhey_bin13]
MVQSSPENLQALTQAELIALVHELRTINVQLQTANQVLPTAAQSLLDDQLRRTSLLTQLAIEFRESLDPATIIDQTLRALTAHLAVSGASIILIGPGNRIDLATTALDGAVRPMSHELAEEVIERGLAGWVLRHGSSVALSDVARDRRWLDFSERHRSGSVIVIPVRQSSATLGVLTAHRNTPNSFSSHDLILLEGVAAQLGVALSAARHQASERQRRNQAMALLTMSQFLTAERSPGEVAAMLQEKSVEVFGAKAGFLFLLDNEQELRPVLPDHASPEDEATVASAAGAARLAWASQRIATTGPAPDMTCVALPLTNHGATIGAYALLHENGRGFSAAIWSLLTVFTHVIAGACGNMRLVQRLTDQTHTLEALVEQRTRQVQRSRDVLRVIFDSLNEGILLLDAEERVLAVNANFCTRIAGVHPRELVGQSYGQLWQRLERRGPLIVELLPSEDGGRTRLTVRQSPSQRMFLVERAPVGPDGRIEQILEFWRDHQA